MVNQGEGYASLSDETSLRLYTNSGGEVLGMGRPTRKK